jgi:hypothetical protein
LEEIRNELLRATPGKDSDVRMVIAHRIHDVATTLGAEIAKYEKGFQATSGPSHGRNSKISAGPD